MVKRALSFTVIRPFKSKAVSFNNGDVVTVFDGLEAEDNRFGINQQADQLFIYGDPAARYFAAIPPVKLSEYLRYNGPASSDNASEPTYLGQSKSASASTSVLGNISTDGWWTPKKKAMAVFGVALFIIIVYVSIQQKQKEKSKKK